MDDNTIYVNLYDAGNGDFPVNEREVLRYSGYLGMPDTMDDELSKLLSEVYREVDPTISFKTCYRRVKIDWEDGMPVLPFSSNSKNLAKCLMGCNEVVLFAATIGLGIDRLIARYQRFSPAKALLMQAYGAERVETLCDVFCKEMEEKISEEGVHCSARFSPGYGDFPLEKQKDFFDLLDCNRKIGVSLNESLLMTPSKSVTAVFGIGSCVSKKQEHKCEDCENVNCEYRQISNSNCGQAEEA